MSLIPLVNTCNRCLAGEEVECFFNGAHSHDIYLKSGHVLKHVTLEECAFDKDIDHGCLYYMFENIGENREFKRGSGLEYTHCHVCAEEIVCVAKNKIAWD